jgi:hypothetical protein
MDSLRAKEILAAYRPTEGEAVDPLVAEALDHARRDPALGRWLEQQTAFDAAIGAKLRQMSVPADLKGRILAHQKTPRPAIMVWWRQPAFLAAAAMIIFVGVALGLFLSPRRDFNGYRRQMVAFVAEGYKMNVESKDLNQLRQAFTAKGWPSDYMVPLALQSLPVEGGVMLEWRGHKVSLVCWSAPGEEQKGEQGEAEEKEEKGTWLFVMEGAAPPNAPTGDTPQFAMVGELATASWSLDGTLYVLASRSDLDSLHKAF